MNKLNKLFREITATNPFAVPELVNEDTNYYYFKINNGWITEISKDRLDELGEFQLYIEAKYIIDNYIMEL